MFYQWNLTVPQDQQERVEKSLEAQFGPKEMGIWGVTNGAHWALTPEAKPETREQRALIEQFGSDEPLPRNTPFSPEEDAVEAMLYSWYAMWTMIEVVNDAITGQW